MHPTMNRAVKKSRNQFCETNENATLRKTKNDDASVRRLVTECLGHPFRDSRADFGTPWPARYSPQNEHGFPRAE